MGAEIGAFVTTLTNLPSSLRLLHFLTTELSVSLSVSQHCQPNLTTELDGLAATLYNCIPVVLGSNLGWDTGHPE
jgi:hypothetical protein